MSTCELEKKVKELRELKRLSEELTAEITTIEDEIKAHMGDSEEMIAGEYKIKWTRFISSRFDSTAFKKAMPELANQFMKKTETRRFSVV